MKPTISIIIPTYNHAHFLPYSIQSALEQTFEDFEVIIVDDGSTDETHEVVSHFHDPRIRYIYQTNKGLAATRNTGIYASQGEYLAFLDADDLFLEKKLELQLNWFSLHPDAGLVAGGWNFIGDHGQILEVYHPGPRFPEMSVKGWLHSCHVCPISVLARRDWVNQVSGFDETLRQVEDWDLWLRLAYAGCEMGWVNDLVGSYRISPGQMTRNAVVQKLSSIQMMDKFFRQPNLPQFLLDMKSIIYTRLYVISAGREYGAGQWQDAQESLVKAMEYSPQLKEKWDAEHLRMLFVWEDSAYNRSDKQLSPIDFRNYVFAHLPEPAQAIKDQKRHLMGEASQKTFYRAYSQKNWNLIGNAAKMIALNSPGQLLNRGFWSILFKSFSHLKQS